MAKSSFHNRTPLSFLTLDSLDPKWCQQESQKIMDFHPISEKANASGKFYETYECWHFHKSSSWPLLRKFKQKLEKNFAFFQEVMNKPMGLDFFILSRVRKLNSPVSNYHKDGYFFDGQLHLTIKGQAGIDLDLDGTTSSLWFPNGQLWYLNGTQYLHKVRPAYVERIELCAPLNQLRADTLIKLQAVSKDKYRWVDGNHPAWVELRKKQIQYVKCSIAQGKASNLTVAHFPLKDL